MDDKRVPWTIRDTIVALVLFLLVLTGGSFIIGRAVAQFLPKVGAVVGVIAGYALLFGLIGYYAIIKRGASWEVLGFRPFSVVRGIGLVVIWFFLVKIVSAVYAVVAQQIGLKETEDMLRRIPEVFGQGTTGFLLSVLVVAIIAPIVEESFFRGFVYPVFRQRWGVTVAIIASGLLFALAHFSLFLLVPVAVIGFALAYLYEQTDSLGPPIMLHALNNFLSVVVIYYGGVLNING